MFPSEKDFENIYRRNCFNQEMKCTALVVPFPTSKWNILNSLLWSSRSSPQPCCHDPAIQPQSHLPLYSPSISPLLPDQIGETSVLPLSFLPQVQDHLGPGSGTWQLHSSTGCHSACTVHPVFLSSSSPQWTGCVGRVEYCEILDSKEFPFWYQSFKLMFFLLFLSVLPSRASGQAQVTCKHEFQKLRLQ